jgi:hypothetical protein
MNKKGQTIIPKIMYGVFIMAAVIVLIMPVTSIFDEGYDDMMCDDYDNLGTGSQMTCLVLIWMPSVFIGFLFGTAFFIISRRSDQTLFE